MKSSLFILLTLPVIAFGQSFSRGEKAPVENDFPMTFECYTATSYNGSRGKDRHFAQIQIKDKHTSLVKFSLDQNEIFDPAIIQYEDSIIKISSDLLISENNKVTEINLHFGEKALILNKEYEDSYKFDINTAAFFKEEYLGRFLSGSKNGLGRSLGAKCFYRPKKKDDLKKYKRYNLPLAQIQI